MATINGKTVIIYVCEQCFTTTCTLNVRGEDGPETVMPNGCPYPNCGPAYWRPVQAGGDGHPQKH